MMRGDVQAQALSKIRHYGQSVLEGARKHTGMHFDNVLHISLDAYMNIFTLRKPVAQTSPRSIAASSS